MSRFPDRMTPYQTGLLVLASMSGLGFLTLPRVVSEVAGHDGWLTVLTAGGISILIGYAVIRLSLLFPRSTVVEYSETLLGKAFSWVIAVGFFIYLLGFTAFSIRGFTDVLKMFLLNDTPLEVMVLGLLITAVYAAQHGVNTLARLTELFGGFIIVAFLVIMLLSLQNVDARHLLPIFDNGLGSVIQVLPRSLLAFLPGIQLFFFLTPFQKEPAQMKMAGLAGLGLATTLFTLGTVFTTANLGVMTMKVEQYPFLTLAKLVAFPGTFLERMEAVFITVWILSAFLTILTNYYLANLVIVRRLHLRGPRPFPMLLAPLIYLVALVSPTDLDALEWTWRVAQLGALVFIGGLVPLYLSLTFRWWKHIGVRLTILLLISSLILTGCWDRQEIDELGFVLGMAIDQAHDSELGEGEPIPGPAGLLEGQPRYVVTYQFAKPEAMAGGGGQSQGGGPTQAAVYSFSTVHSSLFMTARELATRTDRPLFFEHLQAVIVSEDVARQGLRPVLDWLLRDHEMRRRVLVFVTKGPARDIMQIQPKTGENSVSVYLNKLNRNFENIPRMTARNFLGDMVRLMRDGQDFVICRIVGADGEVKLAGGAVIRAKTAKMAGWLGELEMEGYNWLAGQVKGGVVQLPLPGSPGTSMVWEISGARREITARVGDEGQAIFDVYITTEGSIGEINSSEALPVHVTESTMEQVNQVVEQQIVAQMEQTLKKMRHFYADGMGFKEAVRIQQPAYWKRIQDRWHETVWPTAIVNLTVNAETRRSGVLK